MLKGQIVILGLVLFVFSACVSPKPKPPVKPVEVPVQIPEVLIKKPVGIGVTKLAKVERFKENPFGYYYFCRYLLLLCLQWAWVMSRNTLRITNILIM